jgi:hypothetical protein
MTKISKSRIDMEGSRLDGVGKVTISGTSGVIFSDASSIGTANSLGMRNRIINGDMRVDQRNGGGAAVTIAGTSTFAVDRFPSQNATATGTITGQQSTLGNSKSLKLTATSAVTDLTTNKYVGAVIQAIEAQNIYDLNGKTITISFKVQTNWTGNLAVALRNSDTTRSYVVDAAVVSGTNTVTVTVLLEAATVLTNDNGPGVYLNIGFNNEATYQTATKGSWLAGNFLVSTTATQWAKTTGNYINVTELQLEQGSVATPFERRPIGLELSLCQRYYQFISYNMRFLSGPGGNDTMETTVVFLTAMRVAPTAGALYSDPVLQASAVSNNAVNGFIRLTTTGASSYLVAGAAATTDTYVVGYRSNLSAEL